MIQATQTLEQAREAADKSAIVETLAAHGGNVSATARELLEEIADHEGLAKEAAANPETAYIISQQAAPAETGNPATAD